MSIHAGSLLPWRKSVNYPPPKKYFRTKDPAIPAGRFDIPIRELGRETALEKSTLTCMLDRLEKAGFIRRVPSSEDRRRIHIRRTAKDKALEKKYLAVSAEMTELFYHGFRPEEIDRFEEFLRRIYGNLSQIENPETRRGSINKII